MSTKKTAAERLRASLARVLHLPEHIPADQIRIAVGDLYDRQIASASTIAALRQQILEASERAKIAEDRAKAAERERDSANASVQHVEEAWRRRLEEERQMVVDVVGVAVAAAAGNLK